MTAKMAEINGFLYVYALLAVCQFSLQEPNPLNPDRSGDESLEEMAKYGDCVGRNCDEFNAAVSRANRMRRSSPTSPEVKFGSRLINDVVRINSNTAFVYDIDRTSVWILQTIKKFRCSRLKNIGQEHFDRKRSWNDKMAEFAFEVKKETTQQSLALTRMLEIFKELHSLDSSASTLQDPAARTTFQCSEIAPCSKDLQKREMEMALLEMRLSSACSVRSQGGDEKLEMSVVMLSNGSHDLSSSIDSVETYAAIAASARLAQKEFEKDAFGRLTHNRWVTGGSALCSGLSLAALAIPVPGVNLATSLLFGFLAAGVGLLEKGSALQIARIYREAIKSHLDAAEKADVARQLEGALAVVMRSNAAAVALANDNLHSDAELSLLESSLDVSEPYGIVGVLRDHVQKLLFQATTTEQLKDVEKGVKMSMDYLAILKAVNTMAGNLIPADNLGFDSLKTMTRRRINGIARNEDDILRLLKQAKEKAELSGRVNLPETETMAPYYEAARRRRIEL